MSAEMKNQIAFVLCPSLPPLDLIGALQALSAPLEEILTAHPHLNPRVPRPSS